MVIIQMMEVGVITTNFVVENHQLQSFAGTVSFVVLCSNDIFIQNIQKSTYIQISVSLRFGSWNKWRAG